MPGRFVPSLKVVASTHSSGLLARFSRKVRLCNAMGFVWLILYVYKDSRDTLGNARLIDTWCRGCQSGLLGITGVVRWQVVRSWLNQERIPMEIRELFFGFVMI
jgi:hypothetical protein